MHLCNILSAILLGIALVQGGVAIELATRNIDIDFLLCGMLSNSNCRAGRRGAVSVGCNSSGYTCCRKLAAGDVQFASANFDSAVIADDFRISNRSSRLARQIQANATICIAQNLSTVCHCYRSITRIDVAVHCQTATALKGTLDSNVRSHIGLARRAINGHAEASRISLYSSIRFQCERAAIVYPN